MNVRSDDFFFNFLPEDQALAISAIFSHPDVDEIFHTAFSLPPSFMSLYLLIREEQQYFDTVTYKKNGMSQILQPSRLFAFTTPETTKTACAIIEKGNGSTLDTSPHSLEAFTTSRSDTVHGPFAQSIGSSNGSRSKHIDGSFTRGCHLNSHGASGVIRCALSIQGSRERSNSGPNICCSRSSTSSCASNFGSTSNRRIQKGCIEFIEVKTGVEL